MYMREIKVDISKTGISRMAIDSCRDAQEAAQERLWSGKEEYTGWVKLPLDFDADLLDRILMCADRIQAQCERFIVIGIGGSYLGAKAVIEALSHTLPGSAFAAPRVLFAGCNLSATYHAALLREIREHETCLCVISKSGSTTETSVAYALLKDALIKKYGKEKAAQRIYMITDAKKGPLREEADQLGCISFDVPDDIGGRYSVLTAVGLLPIAVAGIDIKELILGAETMATSTAWDFSAPDYACARYLLSQGCDYNGKHLAGCTEPIKQHLEHVRPDGGQKADNPAPVGQTADSTTPVGQEAYSSKKEIEIFEYYQPQLAAFAEWLKQLFGESEGKCGKGLFPASLALCTDLHSLGQFLQDGNQIFFETVLDVKNPPCDLRIPEGVGETLSGRTMEELNRAALEGVIAAHEAGGVPIVKIEIPELTAFYMGQLIYFFEASCGISAYMLGVNPFDQPGVENYKAEMKKIMAAMPTDENQI